MSGSCDVDIYKDQTVCLVLLVLGMEPPTQGLYTVPYGVTCIESAVNLLFHTGVYCTVFSLKSHLLHLKHYISQVSETKAQEIIK